MKWKCGFDGLQTKETISGHLFIKQQLYWPLQFSSSAGYSTLSLKLAFKRHESNARAAFRIVLSWLSEYYSSLDCSITSCQTLECSLRYFRREDATFTCKTHANLSHQKRRETVIALSPSKAQGRRWVKTSALPSLAAVMWDSASDEDNTHKPAETPSKRSETIGCTSFSHQIVICSASPCNAWTTNHKPRHVLQPLTCTHVYPPAKNLPPKKNQASHSLSNTLQI